MKQVQCAGVVTPLDRKQEIYSICREYGITIIEDDAYYYLQYPELTGDRIVKPCTCFEMEILLRI